jgi:hypothetical protein
MNEREPSANARIAAELVPGNDPEISLVTLLVDGAVLLGQAPRNFGRRL